MKNLRNSKLGKLASFIVIITSLNQIEAQTAMASAESPVPSTDISPLDPRTVARAQFSSSKNRFDGTVSDAVIEDILKDKDHRISPDFQIRPEFAMSTKFWLKIYSQYSTKDVVVYDSKNMALIYEVIDLRPIQLKSRNAVVFEILSDRKIKKTIAAYRAAFKSLSKLPNPKHPSREQSLILKATKDSTKSIHWKDMALSIKSMKGQRDPIVQGLLNGEEYFPMMEKLFTQAGVPVELTRLCLVESSFNIKAGSKVGASGIWQIMPRVGKQYLKMDEAREIDERLSPLKSSLAAAKLLKFNYKYLGSWILAVVAYNHGFKGLPRLDPSTYNFTKIAHLFSPSGDKKEVLGWASKNYYSEYLAILHASLYAKEIYGELPEGSSHRAFEFERLVSAKTGLELIRDKKISSKDFLAYNTDVQNLRKPLPAGFWLAYPGENQNFQELVDYSLLPHKHGGMLLAKNTHHSKIITKTAKVKAEGKALKMSKKSLHAKNPSKRKVHKALHVA